MVIRVMGRRAHVEALREAAAELPLVYTDADAFALARGRIVATRVEDATAPLNALGWHDRPLEIIDPATFRRGSQRPASGRGSTLAELTARPTLTPGDALQALQLLR